MTEELSFLATVRAESDPAAQPLVSDESGEWVRSRFGILGLIRIPREVGASEVRAELRRRTADAYGQLDTLGPDLVTEDDIWSLLLFASVPWTEEAAAGDAEIRGALQEYAANLKGSRKVVLWAGRSPAAYLGRVAINQVGPQGFVGDPVRDELAALAVDVREREALQILLQRRISETDLEDLISVLARGEARD